jgi:hypothetical protein
MATHGPRFKRLSYRDQGGASLEAITEHWRDFTFTSGPVVVSLQGRWGKPQVWASSEAEGKRVLMHAAAIASYDPTSDPDARWAIWDGSARGTVNGATYGVRKLRDGAIAVSKRDGPAGAPEVVVPAQP